MKRSMPHIVIRSWLFCAAVMLSAVVTCFPQAGGSGEELQQKLAAVKQSVAENQQKLHLFSTTTCRLNPSNDTMASVRRNIGSKLQVLSSPGVIEKETIGHRT